MNPHSGHNGPPLKADQAAPHHHHHHHHQQQQHQRPHHKDPNAPPPKWHSYKMLVDPTIHRGAIKMMRYDGLIVPGNPHHVPPSVQDPRNKLPNALWKRMEAMDLPVPRFKIDENYVGEPPKVEVTVENMNDNVDRQFLQRMVEKCGVIEDLKIYFHPETGKHLGLAHLWFEEVKAAKECVKYLHCKSVMGQQLNCYIDPLAKSCMKMFAEMTEEKKPEPIEPIVEQELPPPPPPPVISATIPNVPDIHNAPFEGGEDNVDWSHHHYPHPHQAVIDHHDHHHRRDSRESKDPRRQSLDRRLSHDHHVPPQHHEIPDDSTYQPTMFDPNYWQAEAQRYAAQVATEQPPSLEQLSKTDSQEDIKDENDEEEDAEESDHKVDLDTRLKMLMKGKAGGAMPSFLLGELNDEEEEGEIDIKDESQEAEDSNLKHLNNNHRNDPLVFIPDPPLSRAPSPFLSAEQYTAAHENWQSEKRAQFMQKTYKGSPKSDDRMSLSSLSSGENNILQQGPLPNYYGYYPPPPQPGFDHAASWYSNQYMQPGQHQHYYQHQQEGEQYYNEQAQWQDPYAAIKESLKSGKKSEKNIFRPIIKEAVRVVVQDLTQTLTKDINKRMCETLGFYLFDKWWHEQETKYKEKQVPSSSSKTSSSTHPSSSKLKANSSSSKDAPGDSKQLPPRIPRVEDISSFFDKQRQSMETTGNRSGFGLGFRGTIPKLPAFKKKASSVLENNKKSSDKMEKSDKKHYHSSDDGKSSKKSDKRREQEKRREERFVKNNKSEDEPKKKSGTTLNSIYKSLYSDTDESKDTDLSDLDLDSTVKKSVKSPKEQVKEKKLTKKRPSPVDTKKAKKKAQSSSDEDQASPSDETSDEDLMSEEEEAKLNRAKEMGKKSVGPSKAVKPVKSSESSSSVSSSSSSESSSSSASSSSSSSSAEVSDVEEPEETKKKPAPLRRASESIKTGDKSEPEAEPVEPEPTQTPSHIFEDHCYARPEKTSFDQQFANDHGYSRPRTPPQKKEAPKPSSIVKPAAIFKSKNKLAAAATTPAPTPPAPKRTFKERASREEFDILYKFLTKGLDLEDIKYLKISYNMMLERQDMSKMLNYTHWVDHTVTDIPNPPAKKRRKTEVDYSNPHLTGSARTEGYYKMDPREKARTKYHLQRGSAGETSGIVSHEGAVTKAKIQSAQSMSREARSTQRRQLAVLGDEATGSDLLKFNQLKFRRKNMTFGKSSIHDWGLFAREYIGADEMVIEYVGQVVRPVISDVREKRYEKQGIGSSYLFRIDLDYVVDATKCGNLARFINHSCDPNCYAKIITIDGQKKIVIYSKQPIAYGEEITYDYKFPIEDEKILCLCGSKNCRKYLN